MNKQELIEKYEHLNHDCFRRVDTSGVLKDLKQLDEPQPLKLKDITSRMKQLFPLSRNEWIDEILHEFGNEFGLWKYKAGYEQGKLEGEWVGQQLKDADKIRQELNKPVVKQFVADWHEENKDDFEVKLFRAVESMSTPYEEGDPVEFFEWLVDESNNPFQTLVNMHQFGYTVKKEKRYLVKMKGIEIDEAYLKFQLDDKYWYMGIFEEHKHARVKHTKTELEEAGFGWIFSCEGIEVEEVE